MPYDLLIKGGRCVLESGIHETDIGVKIDHASGEAHIAEIGSISESKAQKVLNARNLHILPGVIDTQVHFREPGLEHKEDIESGSRSAALGGVTGFLEMPNTKPPTATRAALEYKFARAEQTSWTNYGFFIGATSENARELASLSDTPGCPGVKIFMGSSTGDLLVEQEATLRIILSSVKKRIAIHAEDEERLRERKIQIPSGANSSYHPVWRDDLVAFQATQKIIKMAKETGAKLHVLHISSAKEIEFLREHKGQSTVECLPQFLLFSAPEIYERLGSLAQMNPPIRYKHDQDALWKALLDGTIDVIGTDHAPHTLTEKSQPYPSCPSGMPGVQTLVPIMMNFVNEGRLSLAKATALICTNPSRVYGIKRNGILAKGYQANFTIIDMNKTEEVKSSWLASKCGWSPYTGLKLKGWPVGTVVNGNPVMWEGQLLTRSQPRRFEFA